jgi:uncharacterized protein (DUF1800 family)
MKFLHVLSQHRDAGTGPTEVEECAAMSRRDAALALRRFGLGARPGDIATAIGDPRGFLKAQLAQPEAALVRRALPAGHVILAEIQVARRSVRLARQGGAGKGGSPTPPAPPAAAGPVGPVGPDMGATAGSSAAPAAPPAPKRMASAPDAANQMKDEPRPARLQREAFVADLEARIVHGLETPAPLVERLVLFWSSHFAVSAAKGPVRGLAGAFEREAIRPHVLGRFGDMLLAVVRHPAMLIYLDNAASTGPASLVGQRRQRGLNENLAREILELHTLGVDGGYTQADVAQLARLLTGWSIGQPEVAASRPGHFFFAPNRHEPGGATVLGKRYSQGGEAEGEAALRDLVRHPATARNIARRLARHFVGEKAPASLVGKLESAFAKTEGDLRAVAQALVDAPEAWEAPPAKIVPPYDYMIALGRGLMSIEPPLMVHRFAAALGQPTWTPSSPKGWPDEDEAWTGPAAIRERLRVAEIAARRVRPGPDARALAEDLLGGLLSDATRQAIARAETREQGIEILAMSPEFLRR